MNCFLKAETHTAQECQESYILKCSEDGAEHLGDASKCNRSHVARTHH